jgi:chromosome segregation protein
LPVQFSRIRIAGFKSFAEPAVVEILPGLTGIVGPNGCGKSNVVEALRWAMGETSAKSLRGGEMDDVIFAGTSARAARNIAEVTLKLDDTQGTAPAPFHEAPELEISRRIERGNGSVYRINGREARARDVQTLFNDLATGAHSSGLVSQGRVGALVAAKPDERRQLLEEAAGITGLHARRHEAELKLRAAEANLERAEDLRGQLDVQLESLKRQARQANRYRAISGLVRAAEAELLALQRARAEALRASSAAALHGARAAIADLTIRATETATEATNAAAALPALRETEGEARTALERHRLAGEALAAEEARARAALEAIEARLRQLRADLAHAEQLLREADGANARLGEEDASLAAEQETHPARRDAAETALIETTEAAADADAQANRATEHAADITARHRALTEALGQAEIRARRLAEQVSRVEADRQIVAAKLVAPADLAACLAARDDAEDAVAAAQAGLADAEKSRQTIVQAASATRAGALDAAASARKAAIEAAADVRRTATATAATQRAVARQLLTTARDQFAAAEQARAKLAAETAALAEVLAVRDGERWPPLVDQIRVPAGLEMALAVALAEGLDSAIDSDAARFWHTLPAFSPAPSLPAGAEPLLALVQAPAALARALSQIGLVEEGSAAQASLAPGQILVSRAGGLWRWDGYTVRSGTPSEAAIRLQQRNRLAGLRAKLAEATGAAQAAHVNRAAAEQASNAALAAADRTERDAAAAADAQDRAARTAADAAESRARADAEAQERAAMAAEQTARLARRAAELTLEAARSAANRLSTQSAEANARMGALSAQAAEITQSRQEADAVLTTARAAMADLPDPVAARTGLDQARAALTTARAAEATARAECDGLARRIESGSQRRAAIARERADWLQRAADARGRVADLSRRNDDAAAELLSQQSAPVEIAARRTAAINALDAAELAHRRAADAVSAADTRARAADRAARDAEAALVQARETAIRAEADATAANAAWGVVAERVLEKLGASPDLPEPPADCGPEAEDRARRKLERLSREREEMGPVNLRAEVEADEIAAQIGNIVSESAELTSAIAKLRGSIGHLNREGRERLSASFASIDAHFQTLFARMFGGGRAHLALVGSDDPLQAGLEIYAQPPGKKLATLSLLSGGEQALTALSLIFAVFRCNPAPVCVLDEVDAPLDDANVDRFCTLLEDMVRETTTRFLVVTHHPMTMARMDRLYGVTMQERGISRLLSVDLALATEMVDPQRMAAE